MHALQILHKHLDSRHRVLYSPQQWVGNTLSTNLIYDVAMEHLAYNRSRAYFLWCWGYRAQYKKYLFTDTTQYELMSRVCKLRFNGRQLLP
jgi:hypothetical protein